jgi:6-phosphogluconolactonase/glucosamine-6-phosphate isomerase/deaminase
LSKSKKIILAVFGEEKKAPLIDLMEGKGIHSSIITNKNLTVYTDIKLQL